MLTGTLARYIDQAHTAKELSIPDFQLLTDERALHATMIVGRLKVGGESV